MATWTIGNMLWRIGELLAIEEQIDWSREAGFDGVGLHASPGTPGVWEGVDPGMCDSAGRRALRQRLAGFALREVHAPFAIVLAGESPEEGVRQLEPVLAFAGEIGAQVVTVHADLGEAGEGWKEAMDTLNASAGEKGLDVGLEITAGFGVVRDWELPHVGVTLDVGHMYGMEEGRFLKVYGSIGEVVRQVGDKLVHLHLHDVGSLDHVEIGTGCVDFRDLIAALAETGYARGGCLEMNPERVSPEGIRRGLERLREWCEKVS